MKRRTDFLQSGCCSKRQTVSGDEDGAALRTQHRSRPRVGDAARRDHHGCWRDVGGPRRCLWKTASAAGNNAFVKRGFGTLGLGCTRRGRGTRQYRLRSVRPGQLSRALQSLAVCLQHGAASVQVGAQVNRRVQNASTCQSTVKESKPKTGRLFPCARQTRERERERERERDLRAYFQFVATCFIGDNQWNYWTELIYSLF